MKLYTYLEQSWHDLFSDQRRTETTSAVRLVQGFQSVRSVHAARHRPGDHDLHTQSNFETSTPFLCHWSFRDQPYGSILHFTVQGGGCPLSGSLLRPSSTRACVSYHCCTISDPTSTSPDIDVVGHWSIQTLPRLYGSFFLILPYGL